MIHLPENYKESMKELLGGQYEDFIRTYEDPACSAIRVNTSKITTQKFEEISPFFVEKIPFTTDGYYIKDTDAWSKHPYYYAGLYYIQEPSAMLPATILPVDENDNVLDLCAAPGGKSTQLFARSPRVLVSNDISFSRSMALVKNLEVAGASAIVTCADPSRLSDFYHECFDKILVDAPCSGEGMFRRDISLIDAYEQRSNDYYASIQLKILENAYELLSPGGMIMYSTCTFSDMEDEQVISGFLSAHADLETIPIDRSSGLSGPYDKYKDDIMLANTVHAFPHLIGGEGHFMALIKKNGPKGYNDSFYETEKGYTVFATLPENVRTFFDGFSDEYRNKLKDRYFSVMDDGMIYMLDARSVPFCRKGIRFVRTGTCIGSVKSGGKFIPKTSLALTLRIGDYKNTINLRADDNAVIKYLKGETLTTEDIGGFGTDEGTVLVCTDGFPLGFVSFDGYKYKNLYEKGWVYR